MSWRLALLGRTFIPCVKLQMLDELAHVTAEGFETDVPDWAGRTFAARVAEYAEFTVQQADLLITLGDESAIEAAKGRLRSGATQLGTSLRAVLGVQSPEEAFDALKLLYGQIGIEIDGGPSGEVTVCRCFFADYYSDSVCRIVEAVDQGLVAGLFDGGSLEFSERLTEGRPQCRAFLCPSQAAP
jgi:hypothetical protein